MTSTLDAAVAGDSEAFSELTGPFVRELHAHCYRMLGSIDDADDVLQETLVAAWRGLASFAGRSSLRVWLYRIATTRCLNAIRDGKRRPPPVPQPPFDPPAPTGHDQVTWLQPWPEDPAGATERRETIELAFVTALQTLPPRQAAALLLSDVLGFTPAEVADLLGAGATAVKGLLQRSRATMATRTSAPAADVRTQERLAAEFAAAYAADDVASLVALLTDDAWLAMPPAPHRYVGPGAIGGFVSASVGWPGRGPVRLLPTRANGQPAYGVYLGGRPSGIVVLTVGETGIRGITRFLDAGLTRRFGLPETVG